MTGSDAFIDMHCGDMNEALVPFNGIEETGDPAIDDRAHAMAAAYGLDYLVIGPLPGSTTTAATALGIPALLAEVGGQGLWPEADVARHAAGLRRALAVLGLRRRRRRPAGRRPAPARRGRLAALIVDRVLASRRWPWATRSGRATRSARSRTRSARRSRS